MLTTKPTAREAIDRDMALVHEAAGYAERYNRGNHRGKAPVRVEPGTVYLVLRVLGGASLSAGEIVERLNRSRAPLYNRRSINHILRALASYGAVEKNGDTYKRERGTNV